MGFASIDDMVSEMTAGKTWRADWNKITAATANWVTGTWNDNSQLAGVPVAGTYPGAALVAQTPMDQGAGTVPSFGMWHGGNVSPDTKHLINMSAYASAATAVPGLIQLIDILMYYPVIPFNSTSKQTFVNSNAVTASSSSGLLLTATNDFGSTVSTITSVQFTNSGGALPTGLSLATYYYIVRQNATTSKVATSIANAIAGTFIAYTDAGTGTHTMTVMPNRYQDGKGVRAMFVTTTTATTSAATAVQDNTAGTGTEYINQSDATKQLGAAVTHAAFGTNIPLLSRINHSTTAANGYAPGLPLAAGDYGIKRFLSTKLSTAYTGANVSALVLFRPLATIPIVTAGVAGERNLVMQLPSMPRIYDGACLSSLFFNGNGSGLALSSALAGHADFCWG